MEGKQRAAPVPQIFDPPFDVVEEHNSETLLVYLPGFKKEQLRVQLTKTGTLIISGEQPVGDNILRRFRKEVPISKNCDTSKISAKFEDFILYIVQPKLITAVEKKDEGKVTTTEAPKPQKPDESVEKPSSVTNQTEQDNESNKPAGKDGKVSNNEQEKDKVQGTGAEKSKESNELKNVQEKAPETEKTNANSAWGNSQIDEKTKAKAEEEKVQENVSQTQETEPGNAAREMVREARSLNMPRKVMNMILALILAIAVGLYLKRSISSRYIAEEN